jgi:hypothetical protein
MPKNIEPYQLAVIRRMNTIGDNSMFRNKFTTRNVTGFISRQGSAGSDVMDFPVNEKEQLGLDRMGDLNIPDIEPDEEGSSGT